MDETNEADQMFGMTEMDETNDGMTEEPGKTDAELLCWELREILSLMASGDRPVESLPWPLDAEVVRSGMEAWLREEGHELAVRQLTPGLCWVQVVTIARTGGV